MIASSSASSSASSVYDDIVRLIAPSDREGFYQMLAYELDGRRPADGELRNIAVNTWHAFCKHGWPKTP